MGWLDADGYLFIADRRTDMVISGGVNVYPAEIEAALLAHPDVVDAAVFGVPDDALGRVAARPSSSRVVAPRSTADAVQAWCRERLADYKAPRGGRVRRRAPPRPERQGAEARSCATRTGPAARVASSSEMLFAFGAALELVLQRLERDRLEFVQPRRDQ